MKIQSFYKSKSFSNSIDSILDNYEVTKMANKEVSNYDLTGAFGKVKVRIPKTKEANTDAVIISTLDAYKKMAELSNDYPENKGIKNLAFHLKSKYESSPNGYLTMACIDELKKYADKILPKKLFAKSSEIVFNTIDGIIKASVKNRFDIKKLDKIASEISTQEEFNSAIEENGFSLDRPDTEAIRDYIAYKVNSKLSEENINTEYFKSEAKVKRTSALLNAGEYSEDILKKAFNEDWKLIEAEKKEHKAKFEGVMSDYKNDTLSLEDALAQSDVIHQVNPKTGNTYIVRKDIFGGFNLYSSKTTNDAILLDRFSTVEELKENVKSLANIWSI